MTKISCDEISEVVAKLCIEANYYLREDIFRSWKKALENETNPFAKEILVRMFKNAALAWEKEMPICQDTGVMVFWVEKGANVQVTGGSVIDAINKGVESGGKIGYLRKSVTPDPMKRSNGGSYGPAIIHYEEVPGNKLKISVMPVGCGADYCSRVHMLPPCNIENSIKELVLRSVKEFGSKPCPPSIIGIGIGGDLEQAAYLARKALFRSVNNPNDNSKFSILEKEILGNINRLGIGPQGLGGSTTCLAVNIEAASCHRANLPVAIAFNCHIGRLKEFTFGEDKGVSDQQDERLLGSIKETTANAKEPNDYISIKAPLTNETIERLEAGHKVLINGFVYTARDEAHKKLQTLIEQGKPLPFDLEGQILYYMGPTPKKPGQIMGSAGPTTSSRMDAHTPLLLSKGLKGMIGKGCRNKGVVDAIKKYKAVYFATFGGLGVSLSQHITESKTIAYGELGTEAIRRLKLEDFPAIVACDSRGNDLYSRVKK